METMHFHIAHTIFRTTSLCIKGVPMSNLAPMKNCPGGAWYSTVIYNQIDFMRNLKRVFSYFVYVFINILNMLCLSILIYHVE